MNENEQSLLVRSGEEFEVSLAAVPSSGHEWQIVTCPREIEFIARSYVQPSDDAHSAGGTSTCVFRFRASTAGQYTIPFVLKRSWEKRTISKRIFQVHVSD